MRIVDPGHHAMTLEVDAPAVGSGTFEDCSVVADRDDAALVDRDGSRGWHRRIADPELAVVQDQVGGSGLRIETVGTVTGADALAA